jgi:hypothetical protein
MSAGLIWLRIGHSGIVNTVMKGEYILGQFSHHQLLKTNSVPSYFSLSVAGFEDYTVHSD